RAHHATDCAAVEGTDVIILALRFHRQLPIGIEAFPHRNCQREMLERCVDDSGGKRLEIIPERLIRLWRKIDEDESFPDVQCDRNESHCGLVEFGEAVLIGYGLQLAIGAIAPCMIGTDEGASAALPLPHEFHRQVPADIVESTELPRLIAHDQDRCGERRYVAYNPIARRCNFLLARDVEPDAPEHCKLAVQPSLGGIVRYSHLPGGHDLLVDRKRSTSNIEG